MHRVVGQGLPVIQHVAVYCLIKVLLVVKLICVWNCCVDVGETLYAVVAVWLIV